MCNRTILFVLVVAFLTSSAPNIQAKEDRLCSPITSAGEGHWSIDEDNFTEAEALRALESLSMQVEQIDTRMDFVSVDNHLLRIKGFLLKEYALEDSDYVEEFCDFIRTEAFLQH